MSLYNPQYKDGQGNIVDLPINAKKLDGYSYNEYSKYYTTRSTTANAFLVTIPYVKALSDGLVIHCKFHTATKSGATLNVNNLGAKGIYYGYTTAITTQIVANNYVELVYSSEIDKWVMSSSYDETTNKCVKYSEAQNLTDAQKKQARDNISAVSTNKDETISGLKTFAAPTNKSGTEQATVWFNTANGGRVGFGKEGANSGTGIFFDQVSGTRRLKFRASATPGAMVWEQPESGSCLYYDVDSVQFRKCNSVSFNNFKSAGYLYTDSNGSLKKGTLSKVATSGSYNDLTNRPTIPVVPTNISAFTNDSGYATQTWVENQGYSKFSGSYNDLTNKPSIFSFTGVISTQTITIKSLQTGVYLLTYNGTKKLKTAIGEVSNHELILETTTTYNNILIANRHTVTSGNNTLSFIQWKLVCPFSNSVIYKGITYQAESSSSTTYWTGYVYQERFVDESMYISYDEASSSDNHYYYPLYRDSVIVTDKDSGQRKDNYTLLKTGPKYAGGTNVTLNGTNKSATTASFYAPTGAGTSGQFLKSSGSGAPVWEDDVYVKYSAAQSLTDAQKTQARSNIGAGTSSFTGYTSSNKLHTDYINNAAGWTSNKGTVTSVRVQAGTGLSSSTSTAQTSTLDTTISIASGYKLLTTSEYDALNAKQDKISGGTNGQLLSSNGSSLVWTNDNRSLLHHDLGVFIENTTTDKGWKMFNSSYNGFLLKSVRFQSQSPSWGVGDFGSGIVFGGADTKGVMSLSYGTPKIKFAGGNGEGPKWWIGLTGTSGNTYDLDNLKYAPTTAGTSGYSLKSNGSGAPRWANEAAVQVSGTISSGAKNNASVTLVITNTSKPLKKGVWRYSGTHGVFLIFAPTEITTMGSPRTAYICGYVSSQISNNTSLTLVEV